MQPGLLHLNRVCSMPVSRIVRQISHQVYNNVRQDHPQRPTSRLRTRRFAVQRLACSRSQLRFTYDASAAQTVAELNFRYTSTTRGVACS